MKNRIIAIALLAIALSAPPTAFAGGWPVTVGAQYQEWSLTLVTESGRYLRQEIRFGDPLFNRRIDADYLRQVEQDCEAAEGEPCTVLSLIPMLPK
jgi:hypothetical protein